MLTKNLKVLTLLFFYIPYNILAQSPNFQHITDEDGLPSMMVYNIMQDSKGYIWLGTTAGICKYDGYKFQVFKAPSQTGNSVGNIKEDSKGRIYFSSFSSQLFYISQEKVYELKLPKGVQEHGLKGYEIDQNNKIWVLSDNLYQYSPQSKQWKACDSTKLGITINSGVKIQIDSQNNIWLQKNDDNKCSLYKIENKSLEINQIVDNLPEAHKFLMFKDICFLLNQVENFFYSYTENPNASIKKTDLPKLKDRNVYGIYIDKEHSVWILTSEGATLYSKKQGVYQQELTVFKGKTVSGVIQDFEGNYWFATVEGVYIMSNKDVLNYNTDNSFLKDNKINCLSEDHERNVLIGTNANEVFRLNKNKGILNTYHLEKGDVECLFFDKESKQVFIENGALQVFDLDKNYPSYKVFAGNTPKDITSYQKDFLAVAAGDRAGIFAKKKNIQLPETYNNWLKRTRSWAIAVDTTNDRIWVSHSIGLHYYENGKAYELKSADNKTIGAVYLVFDNQGTLWAATSKRGIFAIKNLKIYQHLNEENGLISNHCRVVRPENNKLWIGTNKGIQVLDLKTKKSYVINKKDGLASSEVKDLLIQDSLVWVASNKGFTVFEKKYIPQKAPPPLIHIVGFEINDKKQQLQPNYLLEYDENNIKIDFRGISFSGLGKFQYKYRMLGQNNKWIFVERVTNFARFTSLPPGKYTFEVKAINSDGVESKKTARISIQVAYPFWQKWWFILLEILLGILIVSGIFLWRIRAIKRQNNLKLELINSNLKVLKTQMNPHFIFNSLISIQGFILEEKSKDASYYLNKFAKLTRLILEASRQEYISIEDELNILESYLILEQTFTENRFEYSFKIDENIDTEQFEIPPLFIQTFIENAIKHGIAQMKTGGKIQVSFNLENKLILISITDNGIGREQAETLKTQKKHRSLATEITKERIGLLQRTIAKNVRLEIEDILDENKKVAGTKVKLFLPYKNY